jgi:hypothetical protein
MTLKQIEQRMRGQADAMQVGERASAQIGRPAASAGFREIAKAYDECAEMVANYVAGHPQDEG